MQLFLVCLGLYFFLSYLICGIIYFRLFIEASSYIVSKDRFWSSNLESFYRERGFCYDSALNPTTKDDAITQTFWSCLGRFAFGSPILGVVVVLDILAKKIESNVLTWANKEKAPSETDELRERVQQLEEQLAQVTKPKRTRTKKAS